LTAGSSATSARASSSVGTSKTKMPASAAFGEQERLHAATIRRGPGSDVADRPIVGDARTAPMSTTLSAAVRVLLVGGLANVVLSFLLGWILSSKRLQGPMEPHRWLLVAHEVSLQEGMLLLGLSFAMTFARLPGGVAVAAAWLLVAASFFQDFSGIVNWLRGTNDQFAEKSAGWMLASVNAVLNTVGLVILVAGVVRGVS
jgi:hypothetical protein